MLLTTLKNTNLGLAFLLELCALVAFGYWGFTVGPNLLLKIVLVIGIPALAILWWSLFGAPTANWQLKGGWYWLMKIVFFGLAIAGLFAAGQRTWSIAFLVVFIINSALLLIWKQ